MQGPAPLSPEEHLRRALVDLQNAQRAYIAQFARGAGEGAAEAADEARAQASQWGALVRASASLQDERDGA